MVEHFSDLTYVQLVIISNQEYTLEIKVAFERWVATFVIEIKMILCRQWDLSEQPFI